jgi:hypothetical protein
MPLTDMTTALNGYSAKLTGAALDAVVSDPDVKYLTEDSVISADSTPNSSLTGVPVARDFDDGGIRRESSSDLGVGVDIYVLGETVSCRMISLTLSAVRHWNLYRAPRVWRTRFVGARFWTL